MPDRAPTGCWYRDHADAALAVVLTAVCATTLAVDGLLTTADALPASISVLVAAALLGWRRHHPVPLAVVLGVAVAIPKFTPYASTIYNTGTLGTSELIAVFLFAYSLGTEGPWPLSIVGLVPLTVGSALTAGDGGFNPIVEMVTVGPWLAGLAVGSRRRAEQRLVWRARELETEREIFSIQSVQYERARIARELHDIVAHSVSLMVVQAGAGEHLARQDPGRAAEAFDFIGEAARQAEAEIDRLVELLDSSPPAVPPAGLRIVDELVDRVRASGLTISCQFTGDSDDLSELAAQTAYRVVQESVTNAMKYAPGGPIDISVRGRSDAIEIEVTNRPTVAHGCENPERSGLEESGGGHGLAGMRERVARCGGTFAAGPVAGRGWCVAVRLPRHPGGPARAAPPEAVPWL
jgi:signal transduction histidine kinase